MQLTEAVKAQQQAPVSSQANSCSMVRNRSSKMAGSNWGLRPRLGRFLPREFGLMLGTMSRLKMALRFSRQSYAPSRLTMEYDRPCAAGPNVVGMEWKNT